jgi:immune inhibitor A
MTFEAYYKVWRSSRRGPNNVGLDDGEVRLGGIKGPLRIDQPSKKLAGEIRTMVLLVDFPDRPHADDHSPGMYEQMLFSVEAFPSGSMRDFYRQVSGWTKDARERPGIDVTGKVHGWFRMPNPITFYADGNSGMSDNFPRNAPALARDAVLAAKFAGVDFAGFDALGEGTVTALVRDPRRRRRRDHGRPQRHLEPQVDHPRRRRRRPRHLGQHLSDRARGLPRRRLRP